jgi:tetratricopeptide (TPR) repeat protein
MARQLLKATTKLRRKAMILLSVAALAPGLFGGAEAKPRYHCPRGQIYRVSKKICVDKEQFRKSLKGEEPANDIAGETLSVAIPGEAGLVSEASPDHAASFWDYVHKMLQLRLARETDPSRLEDILAFCRAALHEYPRERAPLEWATLQNNLANSLVALGERTSETAPLEEAVALYKEALKEQTLERAPLDWATVKNNLGLALATLGERQSAVTKLAEAAVIKREAREWAMRTGDRGVLLMRRAERLHDKDMARTALRQIDIALTTIRDGEHNPQFSAYYEEQLPKARALVERLSRH